MTELDELKHDIAEYVKVSSEMASEIVSQQAEIERLKSQRDRLMQTLKNTNELLDPFDYKIELVKNNALIAEIEAEK